MTRLVARNLAHLIDEATPYRRGQPSLIDRAMYVRPSWHMASVYVAGVLIALAWLYTR
jgi:hypothetical protein